MKTIPTLLIALAMAFVLVPVGTASASPGALRVLIVYSDGAHTEADLKTQIAAQPGIASVDTFPAGLATPGVDTLAAYDVVVTFSNTDYANPIVLGDNMAAYADQGGIVMEFDFDWSNRAQRQLGGRWASGGYSPYQEPASAVLDPGATLGPHEASSPLFTGVTALGAGTHQDVAVAPRAIEVAKWSDGQSAIAFKGGAIGVNACIADGCSGFFGDYARLVLNAARTRVVGQVLIPDTMCRAETFLQTGVADGNSYAVPSPGVITSWYVEDGDPLARDAKLTVVRKNGADAVTLLGQSPSGSRSANQINGPFPARIPVSGGDIIGLTSGGDGRCSRMTAANGDTWAIPAGPLSMGSPTPVLPGTTAGFRLPVEAIVEPDGDNDGFGDLTQDRCLGVAGSANGCRSADLSVTVSPGAPSVVLGDEITYTVSATDNGPDPAPNVVVTNTLPGGAPTTSSLGTLASGHTVSTAFVAKPATAGAAMDTATVPSGTDDPNASNNAASATVSVVGPAVLSHLTQTHRRWREPGRARRRRIPVGTAFKFALDKDAPVTLRFIRSGSSRGALAVRGHAGANKIRFLGSLTRTRKLRPGAYAVVATTAGSAPKRIRFTIVR